jgi:hypothetical protein
MNEKEGSKGDYPENFIKNKKKNFFSSYFKINNEGNALNFIFKLP